jgi:UDP-glucose 4-epimerase
MQASRMNKGVKVLVAGGAGYIGSHTKLALLQAGFDLVVLDNLCNASAESLWQVERLAGRSLMFVEGDIRDRALLDNLLALHQMKAVLHFARLEAVGESVDQPLRYYDNNLAGTITLCQAMAAAGILTLVFSLSVLHTAIRLRFPFPWTSRWVTRVNIMFAENSY